MDPDATTEMNFRPAPAPAAAARIDPRSTVGDRAVARRRRVRRLRRLVAGSAVAVFTGLWLVIYAQLASGHDPALSRNAAALTASTATHSTAAGRPLRAAGHRQAVAAARRRAAARRALAAAAVASAAAAGASSPGGGSGGATTTSTNGGSGASTPAVAPAAPAIPAPVTTRQS